MHIYSMFHVKIVMIEAQLYYIFIFLMLSTRNNYIFSISNIIYKNELKLIN